LTTSLKKFSIPDISFEKTNSFLAFFIFGDPAETKKQPKRHGTIGKLVDKEFEIDTDFRNCDYIGVGHPEDVKVKTDYKQELEHTSVQIKKVDWG
jgi:hypothetical protein